MIGVIRGRFAYISIKYIFLWPKPTLVWGLESLGLLIHVLEGFWRVIAAQL